MPKKIEAIILVLVIGTALVGVYAMYRASVGKAFLPEPTFIIIPTVLDHCCCETQAHRLFEIYGNVLSDTDKETKRKACITLCSEHSSFAHPVTLRSAGRCGGGRTVV